MSTGNNNKPHQRCPLATNAPAPSVWATPVLQQKPPCPVKLIQRFHEAEAITKQLNPYVEPYDVATFSVIDSPKGALEPSFGLLGQFSSLLLTLQNAPRAWHLLTLVWKSLVSLMCAVEMRPT